MKNNELLLKVIDDFCTITGDDTDRYGYSSEDLQGLTGHLHTVYEQLCLSLLYTYDYYITNREVLEGSEVNRIIILFEDSKEPLEYGFNQFITANNIEKSRGINWIWLHKLTYDQSQILYKFIEMLKYEHRGIYQDTDVLYSIRYR